MNKVLTDQINTLKKDKNAVILAHNYQLPEVQDIADYTGDSLQLARKAAELKSDIIVFCGVYFMAETAKILNADSRVLIPDMKAGCPLADFATAAQVKEWKKKYPNHAFVAYINSNADVKAEIDICCTSSNAVKVVESLKEDKIVFLPDKNLGSYVQETVDKEIVLWPGYCVVHETADIDAIRQTKEEYPQAVTMAHPECPKLIRDLADEVCSTGQMFDVVRKYPDKNQFIVVTEWGMNHALKKEFPHKEFIEPEKRMQCRNMKKITVEKVLEALKSEPGDVNFNITVPMDIAGRARKSIENMLKI